MKRAIISLLYTLIFSCIGYVEASQFSEQVIGRWPFFFGGATMTYSSEHNTVLLGSGGGGIGIYDSSLNSLINISTELGKIKELAMDGQFLYVGGQNGIEVYAYPYPHVLYGLSSYQPDLQIKKVCFLKNMAYLILEDNRLQIISIADPTQPTLQSEYLDFASEQEINSLSVFKVTDHLSPYETFAYVMHDNSQILILDLTNPEELIVVNDVETGRYLGDSKILIHDQFAYSDSGAVLDISDPVYPMVVSWIGDEWTTYNIYVQENYAYAPYRTCIRWNCSYYTRIYNISDPVNPIYISQMVSYGQMDSLDDMVLSGEVGYSIEEAILKKWDISDPMVPNLISESREAKKAREVLVSEDYAYVVDVDEYNSTRFNGIGIFDVSNPNDLEKKGWYDTSDMEAYDVAIKGNHVLILKEEGLSIVDMSDPAQPMEVALWQADSTFPARSKIEVSQQSFAYLTDKENFHILDISDITQPTKIGIFSFNEFVINNDPWTEDDWIYDITIAGQHAVLTIARSSYVFYDIIGLQIVDISDPQSPLPVGNYYDSSLELSRCSLATFNDYIYLVGDSVLHIINFTDPATPHMVSQWQREKEKYDIQIRDKYAYLAGNSEIDILDLSDPVNPIDVIYLTTPGETFGLAVDDEYIFVADGTGGLLVLDHPLSPVYRLYNNWSHSHLFTMDLEEKDILNTMTTEYSYEFPAFHVYTTQIEDAKPVYQFFNTNSGVYFFTISEEEKDYIKSVIPSFSYQGIAYYAFTDEVEETVALHRFHNSYTGSHFFTTSEDEKDFILANQWGYGYEGIAFYVKP